MAMDRQKIENAIDALVALLDAMDGDENLECSGDGEYTLAGSFTDRECDQSDDEPYLAAIGQVWHSGAIVDMEGDGTIMGGSQLRA